MKHSPFLPREQLLACKLISISKPSAGLSEADTERLLIEVSNMPKRTKNLRHLKKTQVEAERELEALEQALKVDADLLDEKQPWTHSTLLRNH